MFEILSPSGSIESFYAAIEAGCDAVYLGGKMFGARSFANNFSDEELISVINYAHLYGVKVYVTCNILIFEREVERFLNYIEFLHKNNVDAVIMQDIGMIDLVHKTFPNLEIHASTQMHIHNVDSALIAKKLGVKRIVLARETPLDVIKEIKEKTGLEIEVFVHGALCASYSGMCLFASSIGPRSGNRGTCTGCCRLPYSVVDSNNNILNEGKYPISMKDLMTIEELDKLMELGITSFKIEGRMKSPSYVYTVTKMYKDARDNYLKNNKIIFDKNDLFNLKNIFHRTYTKGFILGEENNKVIGDKSPNHQGVLIGKVIKSNKNYIDIKLELDVSIHDGLRIVNENLEYGLVLNEFFIDKKQVHEAKKNDIISLKVNKNIPVNSKVIRTVSYKIDEEIKNIVLERKRKIPLNFSLVIKKDLPISLTVTDFKNTITLEGCTPDIALKKETSKEEIISKLKKIQNTIYSINNIDIELDNNLFIPISTINNLKRDILKLLDEKRIDNFKKDFKKEEYCIELPNFEKENSYSIYINKKEISDKYKYVYNNSNKIPKVISDYLNYDNTKEYLVGEIGALNALKNIVSDYSFNVSNSYSVALLHSLGVKRVCLSLELLDNQIKDLIDGYKSRYKKNPNLELIVKTNIELMVLKYKFSKYYNTQEQLYLMDRFKNKYKVVEKDNLMYIYDYKETIRKNHDYYFSIGINTLREEFYE